VPLAALVAYVYEHRTEKINEIFSGPRLPLLASAVIVGGAALRYRRTLLDSIAF